MQVSEATDIQQQAIPHALMGKDIFASSKTGSGKTLAFLIPAVQRLLSQKALSKRDPRALILAPTRELAKQVFSVARALSQKQGIQCTLIVGGENYNDQLKALRNSADHRKRQTMMFSATIDSADVDHMTSLLLTAPAKINVDKVATPHEDIHQRFYFADGVSHKDQLLLKAIELSGRDQALVFTATKSDTERLAKHLQDNNISAAFLHGDLLQNQRSAIINEFGRGKIGILVTTDLASRGLDIANITQVINYDLPKFADEYVHRIGRTGRAGKKGDALSFVSQKDWRSFKAIQNRLEQRFDFSQIDGLVAKFKGMTAKPKLDTSKTKTKVKTQKHSPSKRPTRRFNSADSTDLGFVPVKRKPRAAFEDKDESDNDEPS